MAERSPAPTQARCFYGFMLYLGSYAVLTLYLVWAYVPTEWLHAIGLKYWPQKYWAIAIPVYVCIGIFIFAVFLYPGINYLLTPSFSSVRTIIDKHTIPVRSMKNNGGIPPISDISISEVCKILYLKDKHQI